MSSVRKPRGPRRTPVPRLHQITLTHRRGSSTLTQVLPAVRSLRAPYWRALPFLGLRRCCREERPCPSERFCSLTTRMPIAQPDRHSTLPMTPQTSATSTLCGSVIYSLSVPES